MFYDEQNSGRWVAQWFGMASFLQVAGYAGSFVENFLAVVLRRISGWGGDLRGCPAGLGIGNLPAPRLVAEDTTGLHERDSV